MFVRCFLCASWLLVVYLLFVVVSVCVVFCMFFVCVFLSLLGVCWFLVMCCDCWGLGSPNRNGPQGPTLFKGSYCSFRHGGRFGASAFFFGLVLWASLETKQTPQKLLQCNISRANQSRAKLIPGENKNGRNQKRANTTPGAKQNGRHKTRAVTKTGDTKPGRTNTTGGNKRTNKTPGQTKQRRKQTLFFIHISEPTTLRLIS